MIRRTCLLLFIAGLASITSRALSQQPASLPAIQGMVVETDSNAPIGKATVELRPGSGAGPAIASTRTDGDGKFYLANAAPGSYRLVVTHAGHVTAEYGQRQPGGPATTLTLAAGQRITDIRIAMTAGGVISGRITDKGQPIGLADAVALRAIYTEGQLSFTPVLAVRADDLGEFHLFWLPPGRYYIVGVVWDIAGSVGFYVNPDGTDNDAFYAQRYVGRAVFLRATGGGIGDNEAHVPIFYPGTSDPLLARAIDVTPGAVIRGIDVDASAVPTRHVRGRVVGIPAPTGAQNGQPVRVNVNMRSLTSNMNTSAAQNPGASADQGGNFDISAAVPGRYVLTATAGNLTGRTLVEVRDRDVTDLTVSLLPGFSVSGRVVIERGTPVSPDPAMSNLRVALRSDPILPGAQTFTAPLQPDGSFTIPATTTAPGAQPPAGPPAGDYRVLVTPILAAPTSPDNPAPPLPAPLQNFYVKSIRMGDVDILNDRLHLQSQPQDPLTIVIGTNPGTLNGRVVDDRQQPVPGTTVVLIHDNGLRYRVNEKTAASDASGQFEIQNVPPGSYKLFAWESIERGAWQDPEFMQSFENRGVDVHVDEGGKTSVEVKVIGK